MAMTAATLRDMASQSSDEEVWGILDKVQVKKPKNLQELEKMLQEEWKKK